jgi:hypothetical protein
MTSETAEEARRVREHPGIVFRSGPVGSRPGLARGPDVWEAARLLRDLTLTGDELIARTAELMDLTLSQVKTVALYYADYQDEIDEWIRRLDEEAERAEADWRREQGLD